MKRDGRERDGTALGGRAGEEVVAAGIERRSQIGADSDESCDAFLNLDELLARLMLQAGVDATPVPVPAELETVSALTKALESVALGLLDDHLRHCVMDRAAEGGPAADAKIKEASDAIARLVRS